MSNTLAVDFKLIKEHSSFAIRVYDVCNLLAFIPIQQSVGMLFYYADSVEIPAPVSYERWNTRVAPGRDKPTHSHVSVELVS